MRPANTFVFDGGKDNHHTAYYYDNEIWIEGENTNSADMEDTVVLTAKEALSLLSWLEQERGALEQLVKQQEESKQ